MTDNFRQFCIINKNVIKRHYYKPGHVWGIFAAFFIFYFLDNDISKFYYFYFII